MRLTLLVSCLLAGSLAMPTQAFNPPTMGWSSWNTFALNINEKLIKSQADAMVSTGLADAGYRYINIDDGYWNGRDANGRLRANEKLFPSGMRALADYIHARGLKAGIYSDTGRDSWGAHNHGGDWGKGIGLYEHEEDDCRQYFDDWDFDFIKVDNNGGVVYQLDERERYTCISEAIRTAPRKKDITYNICCGFYPGTWVSDVAHSWRTTYDIYCAWQSVRSIILENLYIQAYTGGGHYNDCDMLEIGRTLSPDEENTHMAYWCITSAPLLIGCDMTNIPEHSLRLLKNPDLIAMNQDKLGIGAPVVQREGDVYVVAKDMHEVMGPKRAVVAMNLTDSEQSIDLSVQALGFKGAVAFYDCFAHAMAQEKVSGSYRVSIPAHGSVAYFVTGERQEQRVYQGEEAWLSAYNEKKGVSSPKWMACDQADQGEFVSYLGHSADNYLLWPNVYSQRGGRYILSIRYATAEPRSMTVTVNDGQAQTLNGLNSGSWMGTWKTVDVEVTLLPGMNRVQLSNATDHMPNIDCMTVEPKKPLMTTLPYLQAPTPTSMDVMFQTTKVCHCWVEYGPDSLHTQRARTLIDGQEACFDIENRIRLANLQPATDYWYRVCAVDLVKKQAYSTQFGDTLRTPFFRFRTPTEQDGDFTCAIFNDLHCNYKTFHTLLSKIQGEELDFIIFNGDCAPEPNDRNHAIQMLHSLTDPAGGAKTPVFFMRGNHEIRNFYSAGMHSLIGYPGDRTYGAFTWAGTRFVMLDCGEDKPDDTPVYAGLNDFTQLRADQLAFLQTELKSKAFRKARQRVLISHIPVFGNDDKYRPCTELWGPLLSRQPFNIAIGAHVHNAQFHPTGTDGAPFPVFTGGGPSADQATVALLTKRGKSLRLRVVSANEKLCWEEEL